MVYLKVELFSYQLPQYSEASLYLGESTEPFITNPKVKFLYKEPQTL